MQGIREIQKAGRGGRIGSIIARTLAGRMLLPPTGGLQGPTETSPDIMGADYDIDEIIEWVRQGLIGGAALGLKPVIDGVPAAHGCTQSRANEVIQNYLLPPNGDLVNLWNIAAFIALNLAQGYEPIEKKSPRVMAAKPKRKPRQTTNISSKSPTA